MRVILLLAVLLVSTVTASAPSWLHWAEFCGNVMVPRVQVPKAIATVQSQGCKEATVTYITDDHYLVYGVKIVRTEY